MSEKLIINHMEKKDWKKYNNINKLFNKTINFINPILYIYFFLPVIVLLTITIPSIINMIYVYNSFNTNLVPVIIQKVPVITQKLSLSLLVSHPIILSSVSLVGFHMSILNTIVYFIMIIILFCVAWWLLLIKPENFNNIEYSYRLVLLLNNRNNRVLKLCYSKGYTKDDIVWYNKVKYELKKIQTMEI